MRYVAYAFLSLVIGVIGAVVLINSGAFHNRIEQEVRAKTGVPIKLGRIRIPLQWPLTVTIEATQLPIPSVTMEFKKAVVTIGALTEPYDFRVTVLEPKVILQGPVTAFNAGSGTPAGGPGSGPAAAPTRFRLFLTVIDGELQATDLTISKLNVEFDQKQWMKTPAKLKASARVRSQFFPGELPISVQTDSLVFSEESVKATAVRASFAGLNATVQGTTLIKEGRHRWVAEVKAPDLSQVPAPFEIPASQWQGSVELNAELTKESKDKPWSADGRGTFKNVKAKVKWKNEKLSVDGPVLMNIDGKFNYFENKISIPSLNGFIDLEMAQVDAYGILSKPPNTAFRVDVAAAATADKFDIKKLEAKLWQLKAEVAGTVAMQPPYDGKLTLDLKPTPLKGLEAIILPLKNSLVQGDVAVQGEWSGPLTDPWASQIILKNLRLKNFSADVNYDAEGAVKARGPIAATIEAHGEIDKGKPKSFKASGNVQLGGLALVAGPLRKEAKQALAANFTVRSDGVALQIDQMAVTGFLGQVKASGTVSEPLRPKVNLRLEMKPLDLSEARVALPEYRDLVPKGSVAGWITLLGEIAIGTPWPTWPLTVGGNVKVNLPEYRVLPPTPDAPPAALPPVTGTTGDTPVIGGGFLPKGVLTEKLNMQVAAAIGILTKDKLTVKGVDASGTIAKGKFTGGVTLTEIFGGKVTLTDTEVPLFEPLPLLQGHVAVEQMIVQDAMEFVKPEYKNMATGRATGSSKFATRLPSDARFMDELKANGQITLEPITLNTVQVGKMLNDMIAKVPVLKIPPAKVEPLKGMVKADFTLAGQALNLAPLFARDMDGSELELKGKVVLPTLQGDLVGNFLWVNPQVKGCVLEGNADDKGRLIVPIALKGNLMQPELNMVTDMVNKLAGKALDCEKKKIVEQIKQDGGKKLEAEAKKVLKGILGK